MTDLEPHLLLRAGRIEEAERAYERVLERSPFDVQALNIVALASIRMGQFHRARSLLERAVAADPGHATSHHHLGRARELLGDFAGAAESYRKAVTLGPGLPAARLHLAAVLERAGELHAALVQYTRAMGDAQRQGKWLDRSTTPPALVELVAHAAQVVRRGRRALLFGLIEPLATQFGRDALGRVEQALRIYLGEETPEYPDARQRPSFFFFPGLPTAPYFDRTTFSWIEELESRTDVIREELERLLPSTAGRERVFSTDALERENLRGTAGPPSWNGYYFYRHGAQRDENCAACPRTAAALAPLPLCRIRDHGPEVLFSVFTPGTELMPHRGVTNTRAVGHLPLLVPPDCALEVGGETHQWREGEVVVFDDTYEHGAWNRSDRIRVVLIFDVWNPHLTEPERLAVERIVTGIGDLRTETEKA